MITGCETETTYICIDLKSFYASVECVDRGLDPMTAVLAVADTGRSANTICLAITPAMKAMGIPNRCRLGDIPPEVDYIAAMPRMQRYMQVSAQIYGIYLDFVAAEDVHVYSIDEAFIDVTHYQSLYGTDGEGIGMLLLEAIRSRTGLYATCGVGTNLYLAKVAMDILAKKSPGFLAWLDEESYRKRLWGHEPLTDFWRIGRGTASRLRKYGILNMEGIALADKDLMFREFGRDAEILIDHAWGRETVTMADIKAYEPSVHSLSSSQILMRDYYFEEGLVVVREMAAALTLELVEKRLWTGSVSIYVGYSGRISLSDVRVMGRFPQETDASARIMEAAESLYIRHVAKEAPIRRIGICFDKVEPRGCRQLSLFNDDLLEGKDRDMQEAAIKIRERYGKNSCLRGTNLLQEATMRERNEQIGGHRK